MLNCQPENIIIYNIISFFKTLKLGKKISSCSYQRRVLKNKNRGFKSYKHLPQEETEKENKTNKQTAAKTTTTLNNNTHPELLRS